MFHTFLEFLSDLIPAKKQLVKSLYIEYKYCQLHIRIFNLKGSDHNETIVSFNEHCIE
jgi:hypothetical protein